MKKSAYILTMLLFVTSISACSYALWKYNPPSYLNIKIIDSDPQKYMIRVVVGEKERYEYALDHNGKVTFEFPTLPRCCDVYLFGIVKIKDRDPYKRKVIKIVKGDDTVRELTYYEVGRLEKDKDNFSVVRMKH